MAGGGIVGKEGRKWVMVAGAGFLAGAFIGNSGGNGESSEAFGGHAHAEVDKYIAGQPFANDSFTLDTLKNPVEKPTLDATVRGAYREYGEGDPYQPSPKARAIVLCAGAAANALALGDKAKLNFTAAGRLEGQEGQEEAAANAYTIAADGCGTALDGALNDKNSADIVIPVGEA